MNRRHLIKGIAGLPLSMNLWANEGEQVTSILKAASRLKRGAQSRLRLFYPKGCLGNLLPCVQAFQGGTGIKIDLVEASLNEISSQLILEHRMKRDESYDVALPPTFTIPDLAAAQVIAPLNEWAQKYESKDSFDSSLYTLGDRFLGQLYGYQADGDAYLLFMNRAWLENPEHKARFADRYGHELDIPQTWDEVDRQLEFFHNPAQNRYGGSLFRSKDYAIWEFWVRMHAKGNLPFDASMKPQIDHPASIEALIELLKASRFLSPDTRTSGLFENFKSFGEGNKYCNLGWGGTQKYLQGPASSLRNQCAFGVMPGGRIGSKVLPMPYFNWGWNYVVTERSQQKELAYLFCLFASSVEQSLRSVRDKEGYFDPHRREHYEDPEIVSIYGKEFLKAHQESMMQSIPDLYLQGYNQYMSTLTNAIHSCLEYAIKPEFALKKVAGRWNELTDKIGRDAQVKQWTFVRSYYPELLRKTLK